MSLVCPRMAQHLTASSPVTISRSTLSHAAAGDEGGEAGVDTDDGVGRVAVERVGNRFERHAHAAHDRGAVAPFPPLLDSGQHGLVGVTDPPTFLGQPKPPTARVRVYRDGGVLVSFEHGERVMHRYRWS